MSNVKSQIQILNLKSKLLMPNAKIQMPNQIQNPNDKTINCKFKRKVQNSKRKAQNYNLKFKANSN